MSLSDGVASTAACGLALTPKSPTEGDRAAEIILSQVISAPAAQELRRIAASPVIDLVFNRPLLTTPEYEQISSEKSKRKKTRLLKKLCASLTYKGLEAINKQEGPFG